MDPWAHQSDMRVRARVLRRGRVEAHAAAGRIMNNWGKLNGNVADGQLRDGITHRVEFGRMDGYVTVNVDNYGKPFEVFIHGFGGFGSTMSGWCDTLSILLSLALQNG